MPSPIIDEVYAHEKQPLPSSPEPTTSPDADLLKQPGPTPESGFENQDGETLLLSQANGKRMAQALELPQLEVELERAIWQVETALEKRVAELAREDKDKGA
jgi:hypothetical protein